jgi:hypothetical protein
VIYQMIEQWQLRRTDKRRLTEMRKHFSMGHRWEHCRVGGQMIDVQPSAASSTSG